MVECIPVNIQLCIMEFYTNPTIALYPHIHTWHSHLVWDAIPD